MQQCYQQGTLTLHLSPFLPAVLGSVFYTPFCCVSLMIYFVDDTGFTCFSFFNKCEIHITQFTILKCTTHGHVSCIHKVVQAPGRKTEGEARATSAASSMGARNWPSQRAQSPDPNHGCLASRWGRAHSGGHLWALVWLSPVLLSSSELCELPRPQQRHSPGMARGPLSDLGRPNSKQGHFQPKERNLCLFHFCRGSILQVSGVRGIALCPGVWEWLALLGHVAHMWGPHFPPSPWHTLHKPGFAQ